MDSQPPFMVSRPVPLNCPDGSHSITHMLLPLVIPAVEPSDSTMNQGKCDPNEAAAAEEDAVPSRKAKKAGADADPETSTTGRWTKEEHRRFVEAYRLFGKNWKKVQEYVGTRTTTQARSHAQKYFSKMQKGAESGGELSSSDGTSASPLPTLVPKAASECRKDSEEVQAPFVKAIKKAGKRSRPSSPEVVHLVPEAIPEPERKVLPPPALEAPVCPERSWDLLENTPAGLALGLERELARMDSQRQEVTPQFALVEVGQPEPAFDNLLPEFIQPLDLPGPAEAAGLMWDA